MVTYKTKYQVKDMLSLADVNPLRQGHQQEHLSYELTVTGAVLVPHWVVSLVFFGIEHQFQKLSLPQRGREPGVSETPEQLSL